MATEVLELQVRTTGTAAASQQLKGIADAGKLAAETMSLLRNALVLVGAVRIGQGFIEFVDSFDAIHDRVAPFTKDQEQLNSVLGALGRIAQESAQPLERVSEIYTRLAPAAAQAGLSQQRLIDSTRGFTDILVANGRSLEDAKTSATQLSAALQKGGVDQRAWTALVKNAGPVAEILATSVGKSVGEISAMIQKNPGILRTADVFKALADASDAASKRLDSTVDSISDGFQRIATAAQFFFGRLAEATGVGKSGLDFLSLLAENIDKVVLAVAGLAALGTIGFVLTNVTTIIGSFLTIAKNLIFVLSLIGPLVTGLANIFLLLWTVIAANPVVALAVAIGAVVIYFTALDGELKNIIPTMDSVIGTLNVMISAWVAGVMTIVDAWNKFPKLLQEIFEDAVNGALDVLEFLVKGAATVVNAVVKTFTLGFIDMQQQIDGLSFDGAKLHTSAQGTIASIGQTFTSTFDEVYRSKPVQSIINFGQTAYNNITSFLGKLKIPNDLKVTGGVNLGGGVPGLPDPGAAAAQKAADAIERLRNQIESTLGKFDPYIKGMAEIDKLHTLLSKNATVTAEVLARFGITQEEAEKRIIRDIAGVGNAVVEMQGKLKLLDEAQKRGAITADEYAAAIRQIGSAAFGVVAQVSPLISATNQLADQMKAFDEAQAAGINLGISREELMKRLLRDQVGVGNAVTDLAEKTQLLNQAWAKGAITGDEYAKQLRKIQEAALESNTDAISGFQRGLLKIQDEYLDTAKLAESALSNSFKNLEDGLTDFFTKGKFDFTKFIDSLLNDLTRLAVRGAITGPLAKLLGGGGYSGSTGAETDPFGGFLSGLGKVFNQGTSDLTSGMKGTFDENGQSVVTGMGDAFTNQGGGFLGQLGNLLAQAAQSLFGGGSGGGGLGGLFGGGGGGLGGIFDSIFGGGGGGGVPLSDADLFSSIGFAEGGSMMVGGQAGRDRNLLGLRVSRGERVDVLTQEDQINEARGRSVVTNPTVIFNVTTPDADSFRRSQGQLGVMAAQGLQRAQARNG